MEGNTRQRDKRRPREDQKEAKRRMIKNMVQERQVAVFMRLTAEDTVGYPDRISYTTPSEKHQARQHRTELNSEVTLTA